jgi:hypothetical protein
MIFALVTFMPYPKEPMSPAKRLELFERTAPNYQKIPGLLRKYYIGEPGKRAGGAYEFDTLASAKAHFTPEWEKFMADTYGSDLRVEYFDAPCMVDNTQNIITVEPALRAAATQHAEAVA